jgi:D-alanyl-D-alanine carboxypeptidase
MKATFFRYKKVAVISAGGVAVVAALCYGGYHYLALRNENTALRNSSVEMQKEITGLEASLIATRAELLQMQGDNTNLSQNLQSEQTKNSAFENQINEISGTVNTLQKLSTTDPELLKKYSKIYFLNDNYVPASLSAIDQQYLYDKTRSELIFSGVLPYLDSLLAAAARAGVTLQVVSAYRSFYEQATLKLGYKITYGAGTANQFSADQGYSEHQLGTAVDFGSPAVKNLLTQFASSTSYQWLTDNAYQFGFTLSYPPDNTYYQFEPWHWRFVGVGLAAKLHSNHEYFYNLSQREIDSYLVSLFN